jgi:hypothetical protein
MDTAKPKRPRVIVRGPSDPAAADALRRAIIDELAEFAVDLLYEGKLPGPPVKYSGGEG